MAADTVRVRHIGQHAKRADTMSGEGTMWHGPGDVQTVSRNAWENHLRKYPDLWVLADAEPAASPPAAVKPEPKKAEESPAAEDYESLDRATLARIAVERGLEFGGRASKSRLIELLTA